MTKTTVNTQSTKEEEIQFLAEFAARCEPGSYLNQLLTPRMLNWVTEKIRDDFSPEMLDYLHAENERATRAETELQRIRKEHAPEIDRLTDILNKVYAERDNALEAVKDVRSQLDNLYNKNADLYDAGQLIETQLGIAEETILSLKAKLYDLLCK